MASVEQCVAALLRGEVIGYPTEGVFGVGCDPDNITAIQTLLAIKKRDKAKGLILIAAQSTQLDGYINIDNLNKTIKADIFSSWPGPVTWVIPAGKKITDWVTGQFDTVAVRVSNHPDVKALCMAFGKPIISTSANLSGKEPCRVQREVNIQFGNKITYILNGKIGGLNKPTKIRDACSGKVLRED
ncbi:Sua5/YciO/YrdC/YwlC family protein [Candidatus Enterovibrio altilux]|uniref:Threonylcarbamoyl-AMP synthase n=1 Tax=Candidatus Enterovibrio altilux TaxID=1927128 RepID=A0A291B8H2_9GAMM|nr:Sua5/YciO/YrdC/YwlC family protein [Candidatus Enterovibrio luxaltus]ATF09306.1 TsaC protein (YrdC domain) required for threonylcarbamoyladenosine t(6)A37 modification in tRNA [Candidatus Enterovibrio luxaltus]